MQPRWGRGTRGVGTTVMLASVFRCWLGFSGAHEHYALARRVRLPSLCRRSRGGVLVGQSDDDEQITGRAAPAAAPPLPNEGLVAEMRADAPTFHPDSLLLVSETSYTTINGSFTGSRYTFSLQNLARKQELWKADAKLTKDRFIETATVGADLAKQTIDELQQNGLVSCTVPAAAQVPKGTSDRGEKRE